MTACPVLFYFLELEQLRQCVVKASRVFQVTRMVDMVRFVRQRFRVVDASRSLMSVSEMLDAGHQGLLDQVGGIEVSRAAHKW